MPSLGATDCKFWRYHGVPAYVFDVSPETMPYAREGRKSVCEGISLRGEATRPGCLGVAWWEVMKLKFQGISSMPK